MLEHIIHEVTCYSNVNCTSEPGKADLHQETSNKHICKTILQDVKKRLPAEKF